ncbi:ankyrin repeat domain-containing protein [Rothia kristinae]|uniref:ankyrin repeat domain-containing protein n=1 Tax=Rothia kristinae TaxID=37923 RepID=UPI0033D30AEF
MSAEQNPHAEPQTPDGAAPLSDRELEALNQVFDLARDGRVEELAALLEQGIPVNLTNANGDTLLILAAYREQPGVVRLLLERGADVDRLNDRGQTALVCAVFRNHEPIARMLLEAGADASLGHQTPEAVAAFFALPEMTRLLAEHRGRA